MKLEQIMKPLSVPLSGVKEGQKGGEGVGDGQRMEVILQHLKHLKPLSIEGGASILKVESNNTILEGGAQLALPVLTYQRQRVTAICQQHLVIPGGGKTWCVEPEQDKVVVLEIVIPRLDGRKGEPINQQRDWGL